ncbi:hypothetical protein HYU23_04345 [Candidatus Woesearchaeota archaeon]|nr:hypothetical protein [Candidatus Woesearchaeota archaeon]
MNDDYRTLDYENLVVGNIQVVNQQNNVKKYYFPYVCFTIGLILYGLGIKEFYQKDFRGIIGMLGGATLISASNVLRKNKKSLESRIQGEV